jgi:hypothetical protein
MIFLISLLVLISTSIVIFYLLYKETKNSIWKAFISSFGNIPIPISVDSWNVQMIFFKNNDSEEFDYFNSMKVAKLSDGFLIKPTINHCLLRSIFIPYVDIIKIDEKRLFFARRAVYKVKKKNLYIAL